MRSVSGPLPTRSDVLESRARIGADVVHTPMLRMSIEGRDIWLKAEVLQRTGSFKVRGALNFVASLEPDVRHRGVVAYSSGNHAQGVAAAAARFGIPATIVMPADAPPIKLRNTRRWGALVVTYDRSSGDREAIAAGIAAESGATVVPPYDHPWIIAGQGTLGLEILEDLETAPASVTTVVVPVSGGGLAAGIALALDDGSTATEVVVAEPAAYDDHRRSLAAGERVAVAATEPSICDALLQPEPGEVTFAVNRDRLAGAVVASDDEVLEAMRFAFEEAKLVVEPGGAVGLAALLAGRVPGEDPVAVVLSGGNVDPEIMGRALS